MSKRDCLCTLHKIFISSTKKRVGEVTLELLRSVEDQIELKECVLVVAYNTMCTLLVFQM